VTALADASIHVARGEIVGIIGPNGAGKSTLFGVLSGLVVPTEGKIWMSGDDVTRASPQLRARLGLARTFQRPEPFVTLTVRQHLQLAYRARHSRWRFFTDFLPGRALGSDVEEASTVDSLLELLGIVDVRDQPVGSLPLGTVRRVEVARALATLPGVLLLDEPASGMDTAETRQLASALLTARAQRGISVVLVEHDLDMVLSSCDRVYVFDFGRVIAVGTPDEVRHDPAVEAAYIGGALP
jgi:ABC-type branched-subunit amino acid transport system ATPase component